MRILIVDDEENLVNALYKALKEEGYSVDIAQDGLEGLEYAKMNVYDVIILDIMLPGMDGIKILENLRNEGINTPILMLTAKDATEDKVKGLDTGADDYMTKPFELCELMARIRALLRREAPTKSPILKVADLELNTLTRQVKRGDKEITLTSKEFALLEYMMRNAGRVLTRTQIADHIWDYEFDGFSNIIDVYIRYLRKKIDDDFENKLIHTIRGSGYCLKESK
ncbi:two component transcriptional regulator, winged helix family [Thermoanaerobacter uzonensis DSM 18761]|jgi:heavy metal response regulator|uniref:Stage 0 sporulation protein A homolog n=1 Tax=Thermoanaerobacter uzonensis DSM 18761 TaxID=1123369 RepID=A0A1M5A6N4_9THEO|nr:response regulator transcription factor [Thermoanaerobacter uzonensis]SHF25961.1 two component transcriptional regulator, winged helix family [Thermoanaerobacter uzonensis DSM 18761]